MRLKKDVHTEEYYVYDCPLCSKETRLRLHTGANEQEPCSNCITKLQTLKQYEEHKSLLGAVVSDIKVFSYILDSFTLTTVNGKKYRVSAEGDCEGLAELLIEEIEDKSDEKAATADSN